VDRPQGETDEGCAEHPRSPPRALNFSAPRGACALSSPLAHTGSRVFARDDTLVIGSGCRSSLNCSGLKLGVPPAPFSPRGRRCPEGADEGALSLQPQPKAKPDTLHFPTPRHPGPDPGSSNRQRQQLHPHGSHPSTYPRTQNLPHTLLTTPLTWTQAQRTFGQGRFGFVGGRVSEGRNVPSASPRHGRG